MGAKVRLTSEQKDAGLMHATTLFKVSDPAFDLLLLENRVVR